MACIKTLACLTPPPVPHWTSTADLNDTLKNPLHLQEFRAFLDTENNSEYLSFLLAVVQWKAIDSQDEKRSAAESIYETYIKPGSHNQIHLEHHVLAPLSDQLKNLKKGFDDTLFDFAADEVYTCLSADPWTRFKAKHLL
jgi:hypothetical protein